MLKNILKLTKHSAIYGIGHVLGRTIGFLLLPLHTNFIPPDDYALFVYGYALIPIVAIFYSAGINSAQLKFLLTAIDKNEQSQILATSFNGTAMIGLVISTLIFLLAGPIANIAFGDRSHINLVHTSIIILSVDSLSLILYNVLRAFEKSISFVVVSIINILIDILLNYIMIVKMKQGIAGIFTANMWASLVTLILLVVITRQFLFLKFSFTLFKKLLKFGLPIIPSTLSMIIMTVIDRFIIKDILGDKMAGIYGAGYKLGMFMSLIITAFRYAWYPFYLSTATVEKNAPKIFAKVLTYFLFVCTAIFLLVSIFLKDLIQLEIAGYTLFGKAYWESIIIVPTILASYIFYGLYLNFQIGIYLENKTRTLAMITVVSALLNVVLNYITIPYLGILGAAITTLISYAVMAMLTYVISNRLYPIGYEWKRILRLVITTTAIFIASRISVVDDSLALKSMLFLIYFVILMMTGFFENKELKSLHDLFRKHIWPH